MNRRSHTLVSFATRNSRAALVLLAALGCSDRVEVGHNRASGGAAGEAGAATGGAAAAGGVAAGGTGGRAGSGGVAPCQDTACRGKFYACGNCTDDDRDGAIDSADPDCLGPCDDTEDSFSRGSPGTGGMSCREDCYFDRNSGAGNDRCAWTHECDPLAPAGPGCAYDENVTIAGQSCAQARNAQSDACRAACLPLTPNGCDCFGCCELPAGSKNFVWLGSNVDGAATCDASSVANPDACRPCTPVPSCVNPCEPCELCVGRPEPAAECAGPPPPCASGLEACAPTTGCSGGGYCITGCCVPPPR